jgi:TonB-linked SusC/RagA family outer membrane protein
MLLCGFATLHAQTISGTITDASGEALIGASVLVAGTTTGTVSDLDGNFTLNLPANAEKLVVTYTGFDTKEIMLTGASSYEITLEESSTTLEQVVVTGYGTQTRRRLTTSIASVGTEAFDNVPITNFENALQGRLPGVTINSNSGTLGAQTSVRVRGVGSINSDNQPLYVVDGVIINSNIEGSQLGGPGTNPLVNINPADIQSIDVLKDAASAAIYGSRGSNGVVIITTKSGNFNRPAQVSVNHQTGFTDPTNQYELLSGPQYAELWNRAFLAGGGDPNSTDLYADPASEPDAQWLDRVTRTGLLNETSANVSGGTNDLAYFIGGTYRNEEGWVEGTSLERYNIRINLEQKLGDKWRVGLNVNPSRTVNTRQNEDNNVASPQTYAALAFPNLDPFDENGNTRGGILRTSTGRAQFAGSPLINIEGQDISLTSNQVIAKAFVGFEPIPGLKLNSSFGTQYLTLRDNQKSSSLTTDGFGSGGTGSANFQEVLNYTWDNTASYLFEFGNSELDLTAGFSVQNEETNTLGVNGNTFADDRLLTLNSAAEITGGGGFNTQFRFVGYFLRGVYSLNDKFFVNASVRLDGSSRFGSDNYYGIFPAVSAAYDLARDMDGGPFKQLKIRGSYGVTGNAGIGNFDSRGLVSFGNDYNFIPGFLLSQLENTELTWETARTVDAAVDFETANGFLSGSIGYYIKTSTDLLLDVPQPQTNGISALTVNAGEIRNQGLEFLLDFNLVDRPDFQWTFNVNGATLDNEVLRLVDNNGDGEADDITEGRALVREGEAIGSFFLTQYAGVDPANGDALFLDAEGNTTNVFPGGDSRIIAGNPLPDLTYGFGSNLRYKDLDFSFQFQGAVGHQLYLDEGRFVENNLGATWNQRTTQLNAWTPDNPNTNVPEARRRNNGGQHSTRYLSDADYLRLRNVQLGYTFRNIGQGNTNLRLYVSGANLLTFTDFAGLDPEASGQDVNGFRQGEIFFSRPQTRILSFGFNLNL